MSDLKRFQSQLEQLEKSYRLGIISEAEYKKGRENLEKKIEPLKEKQKKDEESKKIVNDILSEKSSKGEKEEIEKKSKSEEKPSSGKKQKDDKEKKKTEEDKKLEEQKKEKSRNGKVSKPKKSKKKEAKKSPKKGRDEPLKPKGSRFTKVLGFLVLILAIVGLVFLTSPDEEEIDPYHRDVSGINKTLTINYYKSYSCDYCKDVHEAINELKDIYNHTLDVSIVHFPYNIELDFKMDMASECADIYGIENYSKMLYEASKPMNTEDLVKLATENKTDFEECLTTNRTAQVVLDDYNKALERGVENVPVVEVEGSFIKGARSISIYMLVIDNELGIEY